MVEEVGWEDLLLQLGEVFEAYGYALSLALGLSQSPTSLA